MKKVLYVTVKEVPYRTKFFNLLKDSCDLNVIFQNEDPTNRNKEWSKSIEKQFNYYYIGKNVNFFKQVRYLLKNIRKNKYDLIVFGGFNDKVQLFTMFLLRLKNKKIILNFDGEISLDDKGIKGLIKRFAIGLAGGYLVAGNIASEKMRKYTKKKVFPYHFGSLTNAEIEHNKNMIAERDNYILVVGQFVNAKGLDIALKAAKEIDVKFKFVGTGYDADSFKKMADEIGPQNIEIVPFLQKDELEIEYKKCRLLCLPSRKECWGLVINEAASYGTPIVSTNGSGAAVEFLSEKYNEILANPGEVESLVNKINLLLSYDKNRLTDFSNYLKEKSNNYSIENSVMEHIKCFNEF